MPVSRLRYPRPTGRRDTVNPYTAAGRLLYDRLIAAVTGIRYDITMEIVMERDVRHSAQRRRQTTTGIPFVAGPGSREATRRRGQRLAQHPSVERRFPRQDPTRIMELVGA